MAEADAGYAREASGGAGASQATLSSLTARHWGFCVALGFLALGIAMLRQNRSKIYLLDFTCYVPEKRMKKHVDWLKDRIVKSGVFTDDSMKFLFKCLDQAGIGKVQCFPDCALETLARVTEMTVEEQHRGVDFGGRIQEAEASAFSTVAQLLKKTGIEASEVGIVMTACDCFGPQPSMSARLVNHFKMRSDVLTYSMCGMGCANGGVCIDFAKHLLRANPETLCLIYNHENISSGGYIGNDTSMLLPYCLFRTSSAAAFVSNRRRDAQRAKYELVCSVRTHLGAEDAPNRCIAEAIDPIGLPGIRITKDVVPAAGQALKLNLARLGKKTLPTSELVKVLLKKKYRPDFKKAFDHFLIQVGGKAVLDGVERALALPPHLMKPSRDSLHRFANTAGASSWYTLTSLESGNGVKKNDRIMAIMFGAGFKAISVVWQARRDIMEVHPAWTAMASFD